MLRRCRAALAFRKEEDGVAAMGPILARREPQRRYENRHACVGRRGSHGAHGTGGGTAAAVGYRRSGGAEGWQPVGRDQVPQRAPNRRGRRVDVEQGAGRRVRYGDPVEKGGQGRVDRVERARVLERRHDVRVHGRDEQGDGGGVPSTLRSAVSPAHDRLGDKTGQLEDGDAGQGVLEAAPDGPWQSARRCYQTKQGSDDPLAGEDHHEGAHQNAEQAEDTACMGSRGERGRACVP